MKRTRTLPLLLSSVFFMAALGPARASTPEHDAQFSQVRGKVRVKSAMGAFRTVHVGNRAYAGETIQVGAKSQAQLTLFDGSTLDLSANTKIKLGALKPAGQDKTIFLHMDVGKLFAKVRKLFSSHSSFEVEAGGTVCGVRGTAFGLGYNPDTKGLDLDVSEGKVGVTSGGITIIFNAGQKGHFVNGQLTGGTGMGGNSGKGNGKGGGGNSGGNNGGNGNGGNNGGNNGNTGNPGGNGGSPDNGNPSPNNGNPGDQGPSPTGTGGNSALNDLNTQFTQGILVNGDNSLSAANQAINIHLVIPPGENVP